VLFMLAAACDREHMSLMFEVLRIVSQVPNILP